MLSIIKKDKQAWGQILVLIGKPSEWTRFQPLFLYIVSLTSEMLLKSCKIHNPPQISNEFCWYVKQEVSRTNVQCLLQKQKPALTFSPDKGTFHECKSMFQQGLTKDHLPNQNINNNSSVITYWWLWERSLVLGFFFVFLFFFLLWASRTKLESRKYYLWIGSAKADCTLWCSGLFYFTMIIILKNNKEINVNTQT